MYTVLWGGQEERRQPSAICAVNHGASLLPCVNWKPSTFHLVLWPRCARALPPLPPRPSPPAIVLRSTAPTQHRPPPLSMPLSWLLRTPSSSYNHARPVMRGSRLCSPPLRQPDDADEPAVVDTAIPSPHLSDRRADKQHIRLNRRVGHARLRVGGCERGRPLVDLVAPVSREKNVALCGDVGRGRLRFGRSDRRRAGSRLRLGLRSGRRGPGARFTARAAAWRGRAGRGARRGLLAFG